jgi:hypothetical protein
MGTSLEEEWEVVAEKVSTKTEETDALDTVTEGIAELFTPTENVPSNLMEKLSIEEHESPKRERAGSDEIEPPKKPKVLEDHPPLQGPVDYDEIISNRGATCLGRKIEAFTNGLSCELSSWVYGHIHIVAKKYGETESENVMDLACAAMKQVREATKRFEAAFAKHISDPYDAMENEIFTLQNEIAHLKLLNKELLAENKELQDMPRRIDALNRRLEERGNKIQQLLTDNCYYRKKLHLDLATDDVPEPHN